MAAGSSSEASLPELLSLLTGKEFDTAHRHKLRELLRCFLLTCASGRGVAECFPSSNPHSVSSLLVQKLLHQFQRAFLATPSSDQLTTSSRHHPPGVAGGVVDQVSLREFLQEETILFLLLSIHTISRQVEATYPELAELLLVVIKTLLSRDPQFTVSQGTVLDSVPSTEWWGLSLRASPPESPANQSPLPPLRKLLEMRITLLSPLLLLPRRLHPPHVPQSLQLQSSHLQPREDSWQQSLER
ncbi:hypothetical protein GBAR_LOCUS17486 [Geodia barretti]|uniref:Uncharacterized protein n=1 Tax=Geodia barretti TaxID=519541 RepID=A0AA35SKM1_GEOBA|nr:hypothetical protein GBAR_LOCUS17486 [Geodia barretti]